MTIRTTVHETNATQHSSRYKRQRQKWRHGSFALSVLHWSKRPCCTTRLCFQFSAQLCIFAVRFFFNRWTSQMCCIKWVKIYPSGQFCRIALVHHGGRALGWGLLTLCCFEKKNVLENVKMEVLLGQTTVRATRTEYLITIMDPRLLWVCAIAVHHC